MDVSCDDIMIIFCAVCATNLWVNWLHLIQRWTIKYYLTVRLLRQLLPSMLILSQQKLLVLLWSLHSNSPLLCVILHLHRVHQTPVHTSQQAQSDVNQPGSHEAFRLWDLIFEDIELYYMHCSYVKFLHLSWLICIIYCVNSVMGFML